MEIILRFLTESWTMLAMAAPWVLLGLAAAGACKAFVPDAFVARHLGGPGPWPIVKAALVGAPLPLCSCGVLPAAAGLQAQGARRGPLAAFLVATPETGVDSLAITWALLDGPMTLLRPLAAVLTAIAAGLAVQWRDRNAPASSAPDAPARPATSPAAPPPVLAPLPGG